MSAGAKNATFLDNFKNIVENFGHVKAVERGALSISYAELNSKSDRLARRLAAGGIGRGDLVALCLPRSIETMIGLVAVLKTGAAYMSVDPNFPKDRLAYLLKDGGPKVVLSMPEAKPFDLLAGENTVIDISDPTLFEEFAHDQTELPSDISTDELAYIVYTSGSTGNPKGVEIQHQAILNTVYEYQRLMAYAAGDRCLFVMGPSFDAAVFETWLAATAGATLVVVEDDVRINANALRDFIVEQRIDKGVLPTPTGEHLVRAEWPQETRLKYLVLGGDRLRTLPSPDTPFTLINGYGPAEASVSCTYHVVAPSSRRVGSPPIGRPFKNMFCRVLRKDGREAKTGEAGELYIGGIGLARGYRDRPGQTMERFVSRLNDQGIEERLYRSGDMVRNLGDGLLDFLGRADDQLKIRGIRVEPGEIEAHIREHPLVRDALVIGHETPNGSKVLIAYLECDSNRDVDTQAIRSWLTERLPAAMVPSWYFTLDQFPLTQNGKVDRRGLPQPNPDEFNTLRTKTEFRIAGLWARLLRQDVTDGTLSFFDLGGDSLLAEELAIRLEKQWSILIPPNFTFDKINISDQAAAIERLIEEARNPELKQPSEPKIPDGTLLQVPSIVGGKEIFEGRQRPLTCVDGQQMAVIHSVPTEELVQFRERIPELTRQLQAIPPSEIVKLLKDVVSEFNFDHIAPQLSKLSGITLSDLKAHWAGTSRIFTVMDQCLTDWFGALDYRMVPVETAAASWGETRAYRCNYAKGPVVCLLPANSEMEGVLLSSLYMLARTPAIMRVSPRKAGGLLSMAWLQEIKKAVETQTYKHLRPVYDSLAMVYLFDLSRQDTIKALETPGATWVAFGSNATMEEVQRMLSPGTKLVQYGTGFGVTYVRSDADISMAVEAVAEAATSGNGTECIGTNVVYADASIIETFKTKLQQVIPRHRSADPSKRNTRVGILDNRSMDHIRSKFVAMGQEVPNSWRDDALDLTVIELTPSDTFEEFPGPVVGIRTVEGDAGFRDSFARDLATNGLTHNIVTSVFGRDEDSFIDMALALPSHTVKFNKPSTDVNLALNHQGRNFMRDVMAVKTVEVKKWDL